MKANDWLQSATRKLEAVGIATARLDALILLEDTTGKDRGWLLAHPEASLSATMRAELTEKLQRRTNHEPLAYIRGHSEFYGRDFIISSATLQPRAETETMLDLLFQQALPSQPVIVDVGSGSGALAISAKLQLPEATVYGIDIQSDALQIAEQNAARLHADITFLAGDLLKPLRLPLVDIILANLPYVPDSHTINPAAMQEPHVAIFGGADGLDLYRRLFEQIGSYKEKPVLVLTESLPFQHQALSDIAKTAGYSLVHSSDLVQLFSPA